MFGYVNILKDELKIKDYNIFRAYYCCLCKTLGKHNGIVSRFGLSYDMTFLLIVLAAISDNEFEFCPQRCIAHPLNRHLTAQQNELSEYVADVSCMLVYLKAKDDFYDERSIKGLAGMALYKPCVRYSRKRYADIYSSLTKYLLELSELEAQNCAEVDMVADRFAKICEIIFSYTTKSNESRTLAWLGYNIGRWIYVIDAFSDISKDYKEHSYNPFLAGADIKGDLDGYIKKTARAIEPSLNINLANIGAAYELLNIKRNDAILRNIIYDGIRSKQDLLLHKGDKNESI